jgi:hypothetical protein
MITDKDGNEAFVFDCVCHIFNFDLKNAFGPPGELFIYHLYAFHQLLTKEGETVLSAEDFLREWSVDEIYEMVIEGSDTDMIVAQPLPLTDLFHDGLSDWQKCAEMAQRHPDRAVFWGSVNPLEGKKALELMEVQVKEFGRRRSSSTTSATTTGSRSRGGWTTPESPSPPSRRPRSSG